MSSSNTGYILQIIFNEENELPNTVSSNLSSHYSNNEHIIFPNSKSPNSSCLNLNKEVNNELPNPLSPFYSHNEISSEEMLMPIEIVSFETELGCWATECNVPQITVNKLLKLLKRHEVIKTEKLPQDCRTLLAGPKLTIGNIKSVTPGRYYHFGLKNGIKTFLSTKSTKINLAIGVDGLPLTKSSNSQFWPILAYIIGTEKYVFPVGIYHGYTKPKCTDEFLSDFILETKQLITEGIVLNGSRIQVEIKLFICDAPAKSFILNTKGHSGFYSCSRCILEGEYYEKRVCFPYSKNKSAKKTHNDYVNMKYEDSHIGTISKLVELPGLDIVSAFPLDYMHLVCLGVTRKLITLWMHKGPMQTRLPSKSIHALSKSLLDLKPFIPSEFVRKTRHIQDISRWKATELRLFLLYIGVVVLKNILNKNIYTNFMSLYVSMLILLSPDYECYIDYAESLLDYFVRTFEEMYGRQHVSHNIHGLLHIVDDYRSHGPLDNCSAFPFENYMKTLKSKIRKHDKPLEQLINRYNEIYNNKSINSSLSDHSTNQKTLLLKSRKNGPLVKNINGLQYYKLIKNTLKLNTKVDRESYILTKSGEIIKCLNIVKTSNNKIIIIGKSFERKTSLFEKPVDSKIFNIFIVQNLSENLKCFEDCEIHKKMLFLVHNENSIVMPIVHT
ncbi:Uncharacterized protein FWK35_00028767 [Aphis craccivora]|uniref:DUF4806 domain-containing protein n=1 Tax=Aphis craccivora TaxID=307492 RepID=A0A6G0WYR2_APHCR|nr:Uncharacterized protein FWK35_00028767 [Aphis craccivora]